MPLDDAARKTVEAIEARIAPLREQIAPLVAEIAQWEQTIAGIYRLAGEEPPPSSVSSMGTSPPTTRRYARNQFLGMKRAKVVRQILSDLGPQTKDELHAVMLAGGYHFNQTSEKSQKEGLSIALTKIRGITPMRNGAWALSPHGMKPKKVGADEPDDEDDDESDEATPEAVEKGEAK